jgi:hypothetical protein
VRFDVVVGDVSRRLRLHVLRVRLDRPLGALLVLDRHVVLLDLVRCSTGPPNTSKSSMTIMPWRFLELKTPPPPQRPSPRVHLLRPVPKPKDLARTTSPPTRRAA